MSRLPIAVVVSCHNLGRTLEEAVASVHAQTRRPAELVIVDDGSDDVLTLQVLAELEGADERVIRTANRGVSAARNTGIGATTAPLLVLLYADDVLEPAYLEAAASRLESEPELAFVSCAMRGFGAADYVWSPPRPELVEAVSRGVVHASSMFRREMWQAVGGFDESLSAYEEMDFWTTVLEHGFEGAVLAEPLLRYRVRPDSMYHGAIRPDHHVRLMRRFYAKHGDTVARHWKALLLAREAFILEQRQHQRHLEHRRRQVEAELDRVNDQIKAVEDQLRQLGSTPGVDAGDLGRTQPLSPFWGLDRGLPVDRHFIEAFLDRHREDIRGTVLEIKAPGYTRLFGDDRVARSDVLDLDPDNDLATITADLADTDGVPAGIWDCFILTQTLNVIYDVRGAIASAVRVLKPGGVLLCTVTALNRISYEDRGLDGDYWRFTEASLRELFAEVLPAEAFAVEGSGNVRTCTAFLYGLAAQELSPEELDAHDPYFPLVYSVRAVKPDPRLRVPARPMTRDPGPRAAILMYHRVAEDSLDPWDLCVPPAAFRAHMELIRESFTPVPLPALVEAARAGRVPDRAVAVTFDDGYLDHLKTASPILAELRISATFFVTGVGLEQPRELWWDTLVRVLLASPVLPSRLDLPVRGATFHLVTGDAGQRRSAIDRLWEVLAPLAPAARDEALAVLLEWAGIGAGPVGGRRPMTASELRELASRPGHTIGAHSRHHLRLLDHHEDLQRTEIEASRDELSRLVGGDVSLFAYPFGEADATLADLVRGAGFAAAVTVQEGLVGRNCDRHLLPRLEMPASWTAADLNCRLRRLFDGDAG